MPTEFKRIPYVSEDSLKDEAADGWEMVHICYDEDHNKMVFMSREEPNCIMDREGLHRFRFLLDTTAMFHQYRAGDEIVLYCPFEKLAPYAYRMEHIEELSLEDESDIEIEIVRPAQERKQFSVIVMAAIALFFIVLSIVTIFLNFSGVWK